METKSVVRRHDLDWLRIIGILAVFVFHSTRFFTFSDWHVKNVATYAAAQTFTDILDLWIMPFMFVLSGASVFFSLQKGKTGKFILDKVLRLFIPVLVGVFTAGYIQVYLERLTHGEFRGNLLEWLPSYFNGIYGFGGNFAVVPMHLWYLVILFLFSLVMLPLFLLLKTNLGTRIVAKFTDFLAIPGLIYLMALPLTLANNISSDSILGFDQFNWNLLVYILNLLTGYLIFSSERLQKTIIRLRWISLAGMIALTIVNMLTSEMDEITSLCWILAILGFGMKYLNVTNPFHKYASEAVLPFYILHQTVLLVIGYFTMRWQIADPFKWLINTGLSFIAIMLIYEYLVRRWNVMRFLFGMRLKKQPAAETKAVLEKVPQG